MKPRVKREVCIGSAMCVQIAPEVFELDDEGKSTVVDAQGADDDTLRNAKQSCPVQAIVLEDDA